MANLFAPWAVEHREHVLAAFLDARNRIIGEVYVVAIGTVSASLIHPREVFREACLRSAAGVILAHNHPSGDPTPSADDRAVTKRIRQAGEILEIELVDHLVVSRNGYVSLREVMGW